MRVLFLHDHGEKGHERPEVIDLKRVLAGKDIMLIPLYGPFENASKGPNRLMIWETWCRYMDGLPTDGPYAHYAAFAAAANEIGKHGPVDGLIGIGDGASVAAVLAPQLPKLIPTHPALRFCVLYNGHRLLEPFPQHLYATPISTPTLHVYGPQSHLATESAALYKACDPATRYRLKQVGRNPALTSAYLLDPVLKFISKFGGVEFYWQLPPVPLVPPGVAEAPGPPVPRVLPGTAGTAGLAGPAGPTESQGSQGCEESSCSSDWEDLPDSPGLDFSGDSF